MDGLVPFYTLAGAVHVLVGQQSSMITLVVAFGRDTHKLPVTLDTRVDAVNDTLASLTGVAPRSQKLIFKGECVRNTLARARPTRLEWCVAADVPLAAHRMRARSVHGVSMSAESMSAVHANDG